jgi:hypothetical protein
MFLFAFEPYSLLLYFVLFNCSLLFVSVAVFVALLVLVTLALISYQ